MGRRISQAIDHWPQVEPDRLAIRVNWRRVTFAGLLAATVTIQITIPVTLRFQATSERIQEAVSGGPAAATEVSSAAKADSSSPLQQDGTLVERRSVRRATTDPELATGKTMEAGFLVSKAEDLLAQGDISAARLSLRRAAEAGNARAALLLARHTRDVYGSEASFTRSAPTARSTCQ